MVEISVILPAYNEARTIAASLSRLAAFLDGMDGGPGPRADGEIVVVDDGSTDQTVDLAERAAAADPRVRLIRLARNQGKGAAVAAGIRAARGDLVITTDVDLSYALEDLASVARTLRGRAGDRCPPPDVVTGDRRHPESRLDLLLGALGHVARRQALSWAFSLCVRIFFGLPWHDTQCGLKGFRRQAALAIVDRQRTRRFLADVEIFLIARALGLGVATVPVHLTCLSGDSTVRVVRQILPVVRDCIVIRVAQARGLYGSAGSRR